MQTLFNVGTLSGLTDGQLLERFARSRGDTAEAQAAFTVLVERHGPMVLGVCRAVLGNRHDAEDACQATILVLAQRAGLIRRSDSVASWLCGVARRVALRARRQAARRRECERRRLARTGAGAAEPVAPPPVSTHSAARRPRLATTIARTGTAIAAGRSIAGAASETVAVLARSEIRSQIMARVLMAMTVMVLAGLMATALIGLASAGRREGPQPQPQPTQKPSAGPIHVRVVDIQERRVPGVVVEVRRWHRPHSDSRRMPTVE